MHQAWSKEVRRRSYAAARDAQIKESEVYCYCAKGMVQTSNFEVEAVKGALIKKTEEDAWSKKYNEVVIYDKYNVISNNTTNTVLTTLCSWMHNRFPERGSVCQGQAWSKAKML